MAALSAITKPWVGDTIEIVVVQGLTSSNANSVSTARTLNTSSALVHCPQDQCRGVKNLLGLNSSETLAGKGAASRYERDHQPVGPRGPVLTGGNLVVEARRTINMNNEKQTIFLRGVVPGAISAEQYGGFRQRRRSGTGDQGQRRDLGRGTAAEPVIRTILHLLDFRQSILRRSIRRSMKAFGPPVSSGSRFPERLFSFERCLGQRTGGGQNPRSDERRRGAGKLPDRLRHGGGAHPTGDSQQTVFTTQTLATSCSGMARQIPPATAIVKNVAAVFVTASLPAFARPGTLVDVTVSSIGDAKSLEGGVLLLTPLYGADGQVYAAAQARSLSAALRRAGGATKQMNHPTTGRVRREARGAQSSVRFQPPVSGVAAVARVGFFDGGRNLRAINREFGHAVSSAETAGEWRSTRRLPAWPI